MGLDMYLYLKERKSQTDFDGKVDLYPKEMKHFAEEIAERDFLEVSVTTSYLVGYWRKDNAIHNYFVEVCANGVDECQEIYVSVEAANKLIAKCKEVLAKPKEASKILPTTSGFFFGTQEYDDWYFDAIKYTLNLMEKCVKFVQDNPNFVIIYQASW